MAESGQERSESTPADRVGDGMAGDRKPCLVPGCGRDPAARGLCYSHRNGLARNVALGKTTWAELETLGLCLPTRTKAGVGRLLDLINARRAGRDREAATKPPEQGELLDLARAILDDATGDLQQPNKRLWPIQSDKYRALAAILDAATRDFPQDAATKPQ